MSTTDPDPALRRRWPTSRLMGLVRVAVGVAPLLLSTTGVAEAQGDAAEHPGTPFLEGPTVSVAGATLLQLVAAAVGNVGGTNQSSQVDVLGTQARDGLVGLVVSCEMEQRALQKLLYDLEAGIPFLFVSVLTVLTPPATNAALARA